MSDSKKHIEDQIGRDVNRRIRARKEGRHQVWFGLGMFGLVGWSVAVPMVIGAAVGSWIDARSDSQYSWTLMLLITGLVIGCINAWQWLQRESRVR